MKYLGRKGNFIQINIDEWVKINMQNPENYKLYYGDNTVYLDGNSLSQFYLKFSDIGCVYITNPGFGYKLYIETQNGNIHEFIGSNTTIAYLNLELNALLDPY